MNKSSILCYWDTLSTVIEIERAIESLPLSEKREVFDYLADRLEAEAADSEFPDLIAILLEMPSVGVDRDFARIRELP